MKQKIIIDTDTNIVVRSSTNRELAKDEYGVSYGVLQVEFDSTTNSLFVYIAE